MNNAETIPSVIVFASSSFGLRALETLIAHDDGKVNVVGIVSTPDAPQGRGQVLAPNIVTTYAREHGIPVVTPESLRTEAGLNEVKNLGGDIYLVAGFGKIIPRSVIDLPKYGTLNIHPSMLPKYRGPSPIQSMILANEPETGVTIMQLDEEMDHGPIVKQETCTPPDWPLPSAEAELFFAEKGAELFLALLNDWMTGTLKAQEQDHHMTTFTHKFSKADAEIKSDMNEAHKYRTFCTFHEHPGAYFFDGENRIKVVEANFIDEKFMPVMVVPAGKKLMTYESYVNGKHGSKKA